MKKKMLLLSMCATLFLVGNVSGVERSDSARHEKEGHPQLAVVAGDARHTDFDGAALIRDFNDRGDISLLAEETKNLNNEQIKELFELMKRKDEDRSGESLLKCIWDDYFDNEEYCVHLLSILGNLAKNEEVAKEVLAFLTDANALGITRMKTLTEACTTDTIYIELEKLIKSMAGINGSMLIDLRNEFSNGNGGDAWVKLKRMLRNWRGGAQ